MTLVSRIMFYVSRLLSPGHESTTDSETDGVSERPNYTCQVSFAHVRSRPGFAKVGHIEWPAYHVPGVVLGKASALSRVTLRGYLLVLEVLYCTYSQHSQYSCLQYCSTPDYLQYSGCKNCSNLSTPRSAKCDRGPEYTRSMMCAWSICEKLQYSYF